MSPITNDPSSWPRGIANENPRIWDVCRAIAMAEGYNVAGANPWKLNNPGDISDGWTEFGGEPHSGSNITKFPDAETGWRWLYDKVQRIVVGASHTFPQKGTVLQIAHIWAANWQPWARIVGSELKLDPMRAGFFDYVFAAQNLEDTQ